MIQIKKPMFVFAGPFGRRCETCGMPIPEDVIPDESLDGQLFVLCRKHRDERADARQAFITSRQSA